MGWLWGNKTKEAWALVWMQRWIYCENKDKAVPRKGDDREKMK
jgi:hypothetical protein